MKVSNLLLGSDVERMSDDELIQAAETTDVFAKLSPDQKARVYPRCAATDIRSALWETASMTPPP